MCDFIFSLNNLWSFIHADIHGQQFSKDKHRIVVFCAIYFRCGNLSLTPFLSLTKWGCSWHNISQEYNPQIYDNSLLTPEKS